MKKILIPLDDSPFSRNILPYVSEFLNPSDYEIILFRAARAPETILRLAPQDRPSHPIIISGGLMPPIYQRETPSHAQQPAYGEAWEDFERTLEDEMDADMHALREAGYQVSVAVHFGEPVQEIVKLAMKEEVALVAMATHGRTGLGRMLRGSVAEEVLHHLSIPLLLFHPDKRVPLSPAIRDKTNLLQDSRSRPNPSP